MDLLSKNLIKALIMLCAVAPPADHFVERAIFERSAKGEECSRDWYDPADRLSASSASRESRALAALRREIIRTIHIDEALRGGDEPEVHDWYTRRREDVIEDLEEIAREMESEVRVNLAPDLYLLRVVQRVRELNEGSLAEVPTPRGWFRVRKQIVAPTPESFQDGVLGLLLEELSVANDCTDRRGLGQILAFSFDLVQRRDAVVADRLLTSVRSLPLSFRTQHALLRGLSGLKDELPSWPKGLQRLAQVAEADGIDPGVLTGLS